MLCDIEVVRFHWEMSRGMMFAKKISVSIFDLLQTIYLELAIYVMW